MRTDPSGLRISAIGSPGELSRTDAAANIGTCVERSTNVLRGHWSHAPQPGCERQSRQDDLHASPDAKRSPRLPRIEQGPHACRQLAWSRHRRQRSPRVPAGHAPRQANELGRVVSGVELTSDLVVARALCLQPKCAGAHPHQGMKPVGGTDCVRQRVDQHVGPPHVCQFVRNSALHIQRGPHARRRRQRDGSRADAARDWA